MQKFLILLILWVGIADAARPDFAPMSLNIETRAGTLAFHGELARTPDEIAYGLMFRTAIADDYAMLFDLGIERAAAFWMKDTLISLDMIFVRTDGRIANIIADVPPLSLQGRKSDGKVRWVIEVKAGTAAKLGIAPGDKVTSEVMF